MAANDFGFSSAMGKFDNAFNQKASREYTQAQTQKLDRDNLQADYQNLNNEVIAQKTFSVKDGGLVANVDKILNLSPQLYEKFINEGNRLSEYKDAEGNTVKGRLLKPDVFTSTLPNGEKVKRYGLRIQDMDGNIKPVTQMRSTEDGDNPLLLDGAALATVFEAQGMNLLSKGGVSGAASGLLQGLNLEQSVRGKLQDGAGKLIADPNEELGPGERLDGISQFNDQLSGLRDEGEIEEPESGTDIGDLKGGTGETSNADQPELKTVGLEIGGKTLKGRTLFNSLPANLMNNTDKKGNRIFTGGGQDSQFSGYIQKKDEFPFGMSKEQFTSMSENEQKIATRNSKLLSDQNLRNEVESVLIPGVFRQEGEIGERMAKFLDPSKNRGLDAEGLATKQALENMYGEVGTTARAQKQKAKKLQERFAADPEKFEEFKQDPIAFAENNPEFLSGKAQPKIESLGSDDIAAPKDGIKGAESIPSNIPTTLAGARKWFADEKNVEFLKNLDPKATESVQKLLEEKQISSKADLIAAVKNQVINDVQFKQAALLISYSYNGGKSVSDSLNMYQAMVNDMQTGNPGTTGNDLANTQLRRDTLNESIRQNNISQGDKFSKELKDISEAAVVNAGTDDAVVDYNNPTYINLLKTTLTDFIVRVRENSLNIPGAEPIRTKDLELMDGLIAENLVAQIGSNSEGFFDKLKDIFVTYDKESTLGSAFDNLQIEYDEDDNPVRIQFTNTRGGAQIPADESITWNDFTTKMGQGEAINYLEARAKKVGGKYSG